MFETVLSRLISSSAILLPQHLKCWDYRQLPTQSPQDILDSILKRIYSFLFSVYGHSAGLYVSATGEYSAHEGQKGASNPVELELDNFESPCV